MWKCGLDDVDLAICVIGLVVLVIAVCIAFVKMENTVMLAMIGLVNSGIVGIGSLARGRRTDVTNGLTNGEGGAK